MSDCRTSTIYMKELRQKRKSTVFKDLYIDTEASSGRSNESKGISTPFYKSKGPVYGSSTGLTNHDINHSFFNKSNSRRSRVYSEAITDPDLDPDSPNDLAFSRVITPSRSNDVQHAIKSRLENQVVITLNTPQYKRPSNDKSPTHNRPMTPLRTVFTSNTSTSSIRGPGTPCRTPCRSLNNPVINITTAISSGTRRIIDCKKIELEKSYRRKKYLNVIPLQAAARSWLVRLKMHKYNCLLDSYGKVIENELDKVKINIELIKHSKYNKFFMKKAEKDLKQINNYISNLATNDVDKLYAIKFIIKLINNKSSNTYTREQVRKTLLYIFDIPLTIKQISMRLNEVDPEYKNSINEEQFSVCCLDRIIISYI